MIVMECGEEWVVLVQGLEWGGSVVVGRNILNIFRETCGLFASLDQLSVYSVALSSLDGGVHCCVCLPACVIALIIIVNSNKGSVVHSDIPWKVCDVRLSTVGSTAEVKLALCNFERVSTSWSQVALHICCSPFKKIVSQ